MADRFEVTVNMSWSTTVEADSTSDAMTISCDRWRAQFSDGQDRGLIERVQVRRLAPGDDLPDATWSNWDATRRHRAEHGDWRTRLRGRLANIWASAAGRTPSTDHPWPYDP